MAGAETVTISAHDADELDRIAAELHGAVRQRAKGVDVCALYHRVKPLLDDAIALLGHLGRFGGKLKTILTELEHLLDALCPNEQGQRTPSASNTD